LIEAAGGLLWDRAEAPRRIALVNRHRHKDWALPKGKLHKGETWEQAALREVEEETGYRVKLVSFAGALAYRTANRDKVVRFWNMLPDSDGGAAVDPDEITEVAWLTPAEACAQLTYEIERALVEAWADIGPGGAGPHI
jgi:8-oxo-dGTP pyrophosphatase MutT (NUDIX family)